MTAEEIRDNWFHPSGPHRDQRENDEQMIILLAEIAAQLAELNRGLLLSRSKGEQ